MGSIASLRSSNAVSRAASELSREKASEGCKPLWECFEEGQVLELSGRAPGKLSIVTRLILRAQLAHEVVAYVTSCNAPFPYAPDLAAQSIDLASLVCVRMPESAGPHGSVRATEVLLRSGAFGLVILELGAIPSGELAWQARLTALVRHHSVRLVLMTSSSTQSPSLGPLVSLRTEPRIVRKAGESRALLEQRVLKSKLGFNVELSPDVRRFPEGAV